MDKIFKVLFIVLLGGFLIMFFSSANGYYEYELNRKNTLTEEAIIQFEEDVKNGKVINADDYLISNGKDYSNDFTKTGTKVSTYISKTFTSIMKFIFSTLDDMVDE